MPKRLRKKADHSDEMIKRAKTLALASEAAIADLYLIHASICEEKQKARRDRRRRKK